MSMYTNVRINITDIRNAAVDARAFTASAFILRMVFILLNDEMIIVFEMQMFCFDLRKVFIQFHVFINYLFERYYPVLMEL